MSEKHYSRPPKQINTDPVSEGILYGPFPTPDITSDPDDWDYLKNSGMDIYGFQLMKQNQAIETDFQTGLITEDLFTQNRSRLRVAIAHQAIMNSRQKISASRRKRLKE